MELIDKKLIFCFPYRGAGGVPLLFIRLGNYLKQLGYDIAVIDYIDGFMSLNNSKNLEFIEYKDNSKINIDDKSILILQSMTPWSIYPSLKINNKTKLLFITTIPTNFYPALPIGRDKILQGGILAKIVWNTILKDEYSKMKKFFTLANEKDSLLFLDKDIICNLKNSLNVNIDNPKLLPLFSEITNENRYLKNVNQNSDSLIVGWVGRIADFKVHILNKVIEDLKVYSDVNKMKVKFVIVGGGEKENTLTKYTTKYFSIQRINHITPSNLDEQLLNFDLYFGMGTSALDAARLGVPTIRLDYSFKKIDIDYKYKFLFDIKGYSLGESIESKCYNNGKYNINEVINKILNEKESISEKIYDFYENNHSLEISATKFIKYIKKTKLIYNKLREENIMDSKLYNLWKKIR